MPPRDSDLGASRSFPLDPFSSPNTPSPLCQSLYASPPSYGRTRLSPRVVRVVHGVIRSRQVVWMRLIPRMRDDVSKTWARGWRSFRRTKTLATHCLPNFSSTTTRSSRKTWGWKTGVTCRYMCQVRVESTIFLLGAQYSALCLSYGIISRVFVVPSNYAPRSHSPARLLQVVL